MHDDGLNMRNWGYYEPTHKGHLGLQLMPSVADRDPKLFLSGRDNPSMLVGNVNFHSRGSIVSPVPITPIDYIRDGWINHRDKFLHMLPGNPYGPVMPEPSATHSPMQILPPPPEDASVGPEDPSLRKDGGPSKKRSTPFGSSPKAKKSKKGPKKNDGSPTQRAKPAKKSMDILISGIDMDISSIPTPVCTCTGTPQQCYRWGCGGWQSACCTTTISMYPLPMNNKRRGARIAGRKMSQGAFKKVLEKLAGEGYNFANPIDLRTHWAKHGTNKFVTIR